MNNCLIASSHEGTILVDTPGIGSNEELTSRLMDYLPHAITLIYVIKSDNAGGIQGDRVSYIFNTLLSATHFL